MSFPTSASTPAIALDDFDKVVLKTARIVAVSEVAGSKTLLAFQLVCADRQLTILSGLRQQGFDLVALVGRHVVFIENLAPRTIMGHRSEGMLLTVEREGGPVSLLFSPDELGDDARVL